MSWNQRNNSLIVEEAELLNESFIGNESRSEIELIALTISSLQEDSKIQLTICCR